MRSVNKLITRTLIIGVICSTITGCIDSLHIKGTNDYWEQNVNYSSKLGAYDPKSTGSSALAGTHVLFSGQHLAYASNLLGPPGAYGPGTATLYEGSALTGFFMHGNLSTFPPASADPGLFSRSDNSVSSGTLERTIQGGGGSSQYLAWGSWTDLAEVLSQRNYVQFGHETSNGFFYVLGQLTSNYPGAVLPTSGTVLYRQTELRPHHGFTPFVSALAVLWGTAASKVGIDINLSRFNGSTYIPYAMTTNGGIGDPSLSQVTLRPGSTTFGWTNAPVTGCPAGGTCAGNVEGFLAGPSAQAAGLAFQFEIDSWLFSGVSALEAVSTTASSAPPPGGGGGSSITPLDTSGSLRMVQVGPGGFTPLARNSLASATQDAAGVVTSYSPGAPDIYRIGTAQGMDAGSDALITWGRWVSGTTVLDGSGGGPIAGNTIGPDQGFHYVIGQPTAALPASGTANFTLLGATKPTFADGAFPAGTLTSTGPVAMAVAWGGNAGTQLAMDLTATMPGDGVYRMQTSGGLASPQFSGLSTSGSASFSGTADVTRTGTARACGGSACSATINGFFAGPNAERAGLVYQIAPAGGPPGSGTNINGAAVFAKQ